jgi:hypothetical protein
MGFIRTAKSTSRRIAVSMAILVVSLVATQVAAASSSPTVKHASAAFRPLTGSINLTNREWFCNQPVNLDSVTVTITQQASRMDAVKLDDGCTGRIGRLTVLTSNGDAVKIAQGAHDLVIGGGTIRCLAKLQDLHQDGVQVMGGARITLKGLSIDCGRTSDTLINSNLFINKGGTSTVPPSDIICDGCTFGGGAAHTVSVQDSIRSGVINSTLCVGKFSRLTFDMGWQATAPRNSGNHLVFCGPDGPPAAQTPDAGASPVATP